MKKISFLKFCKLFPDLKLHPYQETLLAAIEHVNKGGKIAIAPYYGKKPLRFLDDTKP